MDIFHFVRYKSTKMSLFYNLRMPKCGKYASRLIFVCFCLLLFIMDCNAQDTLYMKDLGILPNTGQDQGNRINQIIQDLPNRRLLLKFEKGRYDFFYKRDSYNIGFGIVGKDSLTVDGGEATFVFHGKMSVAYVEKSSNITLKNFTVDWDRPYISQGTIKGTESNYVDVFVDSVQYPYTMRNDSVYFSNEQGFLPIDVEGYSTLYNPNSLDIEFLTRDRYISSDNSLFKGKVSKIGDNLLRFYGHVENKVAKETIITLYHGRYLAPGLILLNNKNAFLENITIHHALGMGVLAERCENLYFNKVNMVPNSKKERVFSGLSDAFHLVSNKGEIVITNCIHEGQGDDFANVRGVYIPIDRVHKNRKTLAVNFHRSSRSCYFSVGDSVWFIANETVQRIDGGTVQQVANRYDKDKNLVGYTVILDKEAPLEVDERYFMENASWNPDLLIKNCHIGRRNRARGILVTTAGKVVIENNYFSTAGTAILMEGDIDYWYEAGALRDVSIQNNVFDNCGTSSSQNGGKWEWGEAIVTITPSFKPTSIHSPTYHKNIRIEHNIIRTFDKPILMARSVDGLYFNNNMIIQTYDYKPFAWQRANFKLDGCRNVDLSTNFFSNDFAYTGIETTHMRKEDVVE